MVQDLFPLSLAQGKAFCNRIIEQERIQNNIQNIRHSLLASPRRYGKTSLALKAIEDSKLPYASIDLFMAYNENKILSRILDGIAPLISKILPKTNQALKKLEEFIKSIRASFKVGKIEFEFTLTPIRQDFTKTLWDILTGLDKLAEKHNKKAVIFLDEFQEISYSTCANDIEAAIRHVAQKTSHLTFIFSGSNRHLLASIFDDRTKPLYKLCDRIILERISPQHYTPYIQDAAQKKWKKSLPPSTLEEIFTLSDCHPYYLNVICSRLWQEQHFPTKEAPLSTWKNYLKEETGAIANELEALSSNQRIILQAVANSNDLKEPTSQQFLKQVKLSHASVSQSVKALLQKDYLYKDSQENIRVLDPLIKTFLIECT